MTESLRDLFHYGKFEKEKQQESTDKYSKNQQHCWILEDSFDLS